MHTKVDAPVFVNFASFVVTIRIPAERAWRYRLGVRTRGSQPRDRGSIPRTATNTIGKPIIPEKTGPYANLAVSSYSASSRFGAHTIFSTSIFESILMGELHL